MHQLRLPKFSRRPAAFQTKQITDRSLEILHIIARYRFISSSILVRLVEGNDRVTHRHLQHLYHKGLVNRFAFRQQGKPGEFIYYLDKRDALELLVEGLEIRQAHLPWDEVRNHREKAYAQVMRSDEAPGQVLFLRHEVMISRFHGILELACRQTGGQVNLVNWRQGSQLHDQIEVPKLQYDSNQGMLFEASETEILPHRPDAFFTLHFPHAEEGEQYSHFFYEADRKNTTTKRYIRKLRAHFHFVARRRRHQEKYRIRRVRAVLTETLDSRWAEQLRQAARHPAVSGEKASPLFWFTASEIFDRKTSKGGRTEIPRYLHDPAVIFRKIWATPLTTSGHELVSLLD